MKQFFALLLLLSSQAALAIESPGPPIGSGTSPFRPDWARPTDAAAPYRTSPSQARPAARDRSIDVYSPYRRSQDQDCIDPSHPSYRNQRCR